MQDVISFHELLLPLSETCYHTVTTRMLLLLQVTLAEVKNQSMLVVSLLKFEFKESTTLNFFCI